MLSGAVYERAMWEPAIGGSAASSLQLLPTPSSLESQPTEEYVEECRAAGIDPGRRLYLPGRKWHSQRTLSRIAPMIPTPTASANGMSRNRTSGRSNPDSKHHDGVTLADWARLLPTPAAADGTGGKQHRIGSIGPTGMKEDGTKVQVSLRDAINMLPTPRAADPAGSLPQGEQESLRSIARRAMLPTPMARDYKGRDGLARQGGAGLPEALSRMFPTPRTTDAHTPGEHGRGGRDLRTEVALNFPTPTARLGTPRGAQAKRYVNPERSVDLDDAVAWLQSGEPSEQPSPDGNSSLDDPLQPQLW